MDRNNKFFQSTEELVSMFLGLIIVLIAGALIFNYFQRQSGNVDLAGITDTPTPTTGETAQAGSPSPQVSATAAIKPTNTPVPTNTVKPSNTPIPSATMAPTKKAEETKVPEPTKAEEKTERRDGEEYVVKKGDSLWRIAESVYGSGYNWVDIARENNLVNPGVIDVGQKLTLSKEVDKKPSTASIRPETNNTIEGGDYTVAKGDSLSTIALRAYGDSFAWTKIYEANKVKISNPNLIHSGLKLTIPR